MSSGLQPNRSGRIIQ